MTEIASVMTEQEQRRAAVRNSICNDYLSYRNQHPDETPHRAMFYAAKRNNRTVPGVRQVLLDKGLYAVQK